ncbi:DNA adenine methylase [Persephonella sp. IF05-L8]|uniref:DNA adenine methylase n=1 Tax=Persephonella sp. IF05-L8 TaxID=1158338 RepID=UPI00068D83AE
MKPLIKWTGGKYREIKYFQEYIPRNFERYIEPFFGGGGVFFHLEPQKAEVNDISKDLMQFYLYIQSENKIFKEFIYSISSFWDNLNVKELQQYIYPFFKNYINIDIKNINIRVELLEKYIISPIGQEEELLKYVIDSIINKIIRLKAIYKKENRVFSLEELEDHLETSIRSGIYLFFRKVLNSLKDDYNELKIAVWWFIRELCYGSMFRYDKKGNFNIPYGGINYNKKKLLPKADYIFSPRTISLFKKTKFHNTDFEEFLNNIYLNENDFIFLDPPYDSNFKEYDKNSFTQKDHKRLANLLKNIKKTKWLLVIKNTPFILSLYDESGIYIDSFRKKYNYNVRGRNVRDTEHLIITNYNPYNITTIPIKNERQYSLY